MVHDAELHEDEDHQREFERQPEAEDELRGEGIVFAHGPGRLPVHPLRIFEKKLERLRQHHKKAERRAGEEEDEPDERYRIEDPLFRSVQRRQDELGQEEEDQGKGQDNSAVERELHRDRERVGDTEGLEVRGAAWVNGDQRALEQPRQPGAEREANRHGGAEDNGDLDERGAQVVEVLQERLGLVARFPEIEKAFQAHPSLADQRAISLATFSGEGVPVARRAASADSRSNVEATTSGVSTAEAARNSAGGSVSSGTPDS